MKTGNLLAGYRRRWVRVCRYWLLLMAILTDFAGAQQEACSVQREAEVGFRSEQAKDRLRVSVEGSPCRDARLTIRIESDTGQLLYLYEGELIEHLPFAIYEPDLQPLVGYFADKVIRDGFIRTTVDLPAWAPVEQYYEATNDIIIVPEDYYQALRQRRQPIFWHAAGDATWVHVIYDEAEGVGRIVMRGGVFQSPADTR